MFTLAGAGGARAEVLFQNPGNTRGWDRLFTQKAGTINEVSSPVYKGTTAVKTTQTYQTSDAKNYHSEIIKAKAHLAGQDLYYGHAVYLPADWVFHGQNVTFQQWAPEQPEAPWVLMYLQGDRLRLGGRGAMGDKDAGRVTGLRGTWIRFVTRIHMATDGVFEVWINGEKTFSQRGNWRAHGPSMRWSNGIYCTRWDTETPTGPRELTFFHDNMRIATTYAEADPATWGEGDGPAPSDGGVESRRGHGDGHGQASGDGRRRGGRKWRQRRQRGKRRERGRERHGGGGAAGGAGGSTRRQRGRFRSARGRRSGRRRAYRQRRGGRQRRAFVGRAEQVGRPRLSFRRQRRAHDAWLGDPGPGSVAAHASITPSSLAVSSRAHRQQAWVAELSVGGPFDERHLHGDLRAHPMGPLGQAGGPGERRIRDGQRVQPGPQVQQQLRVEAGAHLAGEHQVGAVAVADQQRAQPHPAALGIGEPADDELAGVLESSSSASAATAVLVGRTPALGDDAFPALAGRPLPGLRVLDQFHPFQRRFDRQRLQQRPPLLQRQRRHRGARPAT